MAKTQLELSQTLHKICEHCYLSAPSSGMIYPCIKYSFEGQRVMYADNKKFIVMNHYTLILIDENPNSEYLDLILDLDYCSLDRTYTADNLNHFVFTLYW